MINKKFGNVLTHTRRVRSIWVVVCLDQQEAEMLSKKSKQEMASIINSLLVCRMMMEPADLDPKVKHGWLLRECKLHIELLERFGVELPGIEHSRAILRFEQEMCDRKAA